MEPVSNADKLDAQQIEDIWNKADCSRGDEAYLRNDVFDIINSHNALLEELSRLQSIQQERDFNRELYEAQCEATKVVQQERDKLLEENKQLQYRDRIVSLANETLGRYVREGKQEIRALRDETEKLRTIQWALVLTGNKEIGVGEERKT